MLIPKKYGAIETGKWGEEDENEIRNKLSVQGKMLKLLVLINVLSLLLCLFYSIPLQSRELILPNENSDLKLNLLQFVPKLSLSSPNILIVFSNQGKMLQKMASSISLGINSLIGNETVRLQTVSESSFQDVLWADAIIVGSVVYNMNTDPELQQWINTWDFSSHLENKIGAVFVTAGGISAGAELTMVNVLHTLMTFRMIIVGGNTWQSGLGAAAIDHEGPFQSSTRNLSTCSNQIFLDKAFNLGKRVAQIAIQLKFKTNNKNKT